MESQLVEEEVSSRHTWIIAQKSNNFWSNGWIMLQCLQEFPEAVLLIIDMQSLLVEEDVWSHQTWKTTQKGHNFWSDRCISLKFLQAFPEGVFRGVAM